MKITKEEKIRYVKEYIEGRHVPTPEGYKSRAAFMNSLRSWVRRYKEEDERGLDRIPRRDPAKSEYKLAAVHRILNGERNIDVSRDTGYSQSLISQWLRDFRKGGEYGLISPKGENIVSMEMKKKKKAPKTDEEKRLAELEEENEYLRTENAVLKKLKALREEEERQGRRQGSR